MCVCVCVYTGVRHTLTVPRVGDQLNNQQLAVVVSNDHGVDSCVVDLLTYRGISASLSLLFVDWHFPQFTIIVQNLVAIDAVV